MSLVKKDRVMGRILAFLFAVMAVFLLPVMAKAEEPEKPQALKDRESKKHVFAAEDHEYHPEYELIMPGDTFEFPVDKYVYEDSGISHKCYYALSFWGGETNPSPYVYGFGSGLTADDFDLSTGKVEMTGKQKITKKRGSTYEVPTQFKNNSQYPVMLEIASWGSSGEDGEWYLGSGLRVVYYKPYYSITCEGTNGDELKDYFWDAGNFDTLNFPKYFWLTDEAYTIDLPNPKQDGSVFLGWAGTSEGYSTKEDEYTRVLVKYDTKAKGLYSGITVNGANDVTMMPVFSSGKTINFHANGGTIRGRESWLLEAQAKPGEQDPSYFILADVEPQKQGDKFLGWCTKESAMYDSLVTKDEDPDNDGAEVYDYFFGENAYAYGGTVKDLYAKWQSDTEEVLEKQHWQLTQEGELWLLNNDGVEAWALARENNPEFPGRVTSIKTGYKDENPTSIGGIGIFADCTQLAEVTFKGTALNGDYTFKGCNNLKVVNLDTDGSNVFWTNSLGSHQFEGTDIDLTINVPEKYILQYREYFKDYAYLFNANPDEHRYQLTVGDQVITDKNLKVSCGEGTATFDPDSSTLTLDNATVSGNTVLHTVPFLLNEDSSVNKAAIVSNLEKLTIVLKGKNVIYNDDKNDLALDFVRAEGDLEIKGDGSIEEILHSDRHTTVTDGVETPFEGLYNMPITAAGDVTIDGVTISKLFTKVPGNLSIKNATINGTNIKAKNMTIENSTILKDSQFGGPLRVEDTFIGITGLTLSVTKSELSNIGIDCGEENVNISFKDSEFTPKGSIVAGTGSTLTIDNSNVNAYGQNGGGITPIPEKNISLKNAEITAGSWSVEAGKPLTIKHTGSAAPGTSGKLRTVKFNTGNAGSTVADQSIQNGKTVTKPADPTREGYTFSGWFTDRSYLQAYDFTAAVDEDFTLYAKWTKASTTPVHTHTFDAGKVTKEPTDTAEGECTYTCTGCGFTKKTVLPKLEAKPVSEPVVVEIGKEINNQDGDSFVVTGSEKSKDGNDVPVLSYNGSDDASGKVEIKGSVVLADGTKAKVTAIEDGALANNQKVTSVVIDPQIKTIGKNAFKDCKNIKSVTIGKNVGKIGENAFSGCKKIKKIYIKGKLTKKKVGKNAFKNVSKKVVVYYAKSLKSKEVKNLKTALKKAGIPNTVSYKSKKM